MADLTIAVSEAVFAKTLEVVVANFGFDVSGGGNFGTFIAGYDGRLVLKGGTLQLRDDGTVRLRELDARWDKLDFTLGVTIPEMSLGGGVVDLGGVTVFSGDPAVAFSVQLAPFVKHELSLIASPLIQYFKPGTTPIGPDCQKLHAAYRLRLRTHPPRCCPTRRPRSPRQRPRKWPRPGQGPQGRTWTLSGTVPAFPPPGRRATRS